MSAIARGSELVAHCAAELQVDLAQRTAAIAGALAEIVPELREDEDVFRQTVAAIRGNAMAILTVYSGESITPEVVAPEQLLLARTLRRQGMSLDRIVLSYRAGENVFWRAWLELLAQHAASKEDLLEAVRVSSDQLHAYLDRALDAVVREYEADRERRIGRALARRMALAQRILKGDEVDVAEASSVLGYDLAGCHTGLVIWCEPRDPDPGMERLATDVARATGATRALVLAVGDTSVWAWIPSAEVLPPAALKHAADPFAKSGPFIAAGRCGRGLDGFRRTHRQALRAQGMASHMPRPLPLMGNTPGFKRLLVGG